MLALVCIMYLVIPGVIVLLVPESIRRNRSAVACLFALALAAELATLSYLQAHAIVESNGIPIDEAITIVREARDKGFTVDDHGELKLGDYVFLVKYRLHRHEGWDDLGTLQVLGWPFGENRMTINLERLGSASHP